MCKKNHLQLSPWVTLWVGRIICVRLREMESGLYSPDINQTPSICQWSLSFLQANHLHFLQAKKTLRTILQQSIWHIIGSHLNDKGKVEGLWNKDCDSKGSFLSRLQHNNFFIRWIYRIFWVLLPCIGIFLKSIKEGYWWEGGGGGEGQEGRILVVEYFLCVEYFVCVPGQEGRILEWRGRRCQRRGWWGSQCRKEASVESSGRRKCLQKRWGWNATWRNNASHWLTSSFKPQLLVINIMASFIPFYSGWISTQHLAF